MTTEEYETIRSDPNSFFVLPGHQVAEVEETVGMNERYLVVKKLGAGDAVAVRLDPRARVEAT
jgi:hypothetical protein